jgi:hypothetical protein
MRGDVALQRLYIIDMYLLEMLTPELIKPTQVGFACVAPDF